VGEQRSKSGDEGIFRLLFRQYNAAEGLGRLHIKGNLPGGGGVGRLFTNGRENNVSLPAGAAINQAKSHQANQPNLADIRLKSPTAAKIFISITVLLETFIFATFRFNPYGYSTG
jgi:hypothetical protein